MCSLQIELNIFANTFLFQNWIISISVQITIISTIQIIIPLWVGAQVNTNVNQSKFEHICKSSNIPQKQLQKMR